MRYYLYYYWNFEIRSAKLIVGGSLSGSKLMVGGSMFTFLKLGPAPITSEQLEYRCGAGWSITDKAFCPVMTPNLDPASLEYQSQYRTAIILGKRNPRSLSKNLPLQNELYFCKLHLGFSIFIHYSKTPPKQKIT